MDIKTTIEIIPDNLLEKKQDKKYWLKCFLAKQSIQHLNRISMKIVSGELCQDDDSSAVVDGFRWVK